MAREVKVAAAQLGPINEGTSRDEVVDDFYSRRHPELYGLITAPVGPRP